MDLIKYKNDLIEAFEEKRIREYDPEIKIKTTYKLIDELLALLGVKGNEDTSGHHTEAFKFINHFIPQSMRDPFVGVDTQNPVMSGLLEGKIFLVQKP